MQPTQITILINNKELTWTICKKMSILFYNKHTDGTWGLDQVNLDITHSKVVNAENLKQFDHYKIHPSVIQNQRSMKILLLMYLVEASFT